jgi:hypothetical protein
MPSGGHRKHLARFDLDWQAIRDEKSWPERKIRFVMAVERAAAPIGNRRTITGCQPVKQPTDRRRHE